MDHDDLDDPSARARRPMAGGYRLDVERRTWWWSDDAYRIHGFEPGDTLPPTDLLIARLRLAEGEALRAEVYLVGAPFSFARRVVVGRGVVRTVLVTGRVVADRATGAEVVTGSFIDLTGIQEVAMARASFADANVSARRRASIEQAKGLIMMSHRLGEIDASELLRSRAAASDMHLHDLSDQLLDFFRRAPRTRQLGSDVVNSYLRSPSEIPRSDALMPRLRRAPDSDSALYRLVDSDGRELLPPSLSLDDIVDVVASSDLPIRTGVEVFVQHRRGAEGWRLRPVD